MASTSHKPYEQTSEEPRKSSWADIVAGNRSKENGLNLKLYPQEYANHIGVQIDRDEWEKRCRACDSSSLATEPLLHGKTRCHCFIEIHLGLLNLLATSP
eukprot:TRINITY_DN16890_c0_g1_i1.p1 TRINITY_DN16890_c0_g1~~TRINITY_DN16890_c0_g1_i1.p1  ORF type:complete len:100 (-),score=3.42 TRINITY_DN16890_c0_g1_i1:172-471(-)